MADYPAFVYYPVRSPPSAEAGQLLQVFQTNQAQIDTTQHDPVLTKSALIGVLTPTLTTAGLPPSIDVPNNALYGRQGAIRYSFTVDLATSKFSLFIATANAREEVCRHLIHMSFLQGIADVESARMAVLAVPLRTIPR